MKKILIFLIGIVSFIGINTVSADTTYTYYMHNENFSFEENLSFFTSYKDILSKLYDGIYEDYLANYSDIYPYYHISFDSHTACITCEEGDSLDIRMYMYSNIPTLEYLEYGSWGIRPDYSTTYSYDISSSSYILPIDGAEYNVPFAIFTIEYFYSNFDLVLDNDINISTRPDYKEYSFKTGDVFPVAQDLFNLDIISKSNVPGESTYTEINLNEYPYVALSLKDYTKREIFYSNVYVKGNYCLTPVYNYGMTERKDIITGSQVQRCSTYYNDFTSVRTYILEQDIENHAIYYLKAYDTTKENIIKVDTSVFDITYITEDTESNPYVNVSGKTYPTIAYDKLTDTATKSEDEDYISGVSCQVGDFNCYNEHNPENIFDEVFSSPLEFIKNIWDSITSIFDIITEFIMLLPETMQSFLYLSFMIAVILGLLKIIL